MDELGIVHIRIAAPAVDGKANKKLLDFLAHFLELSPSKLRILKGENTPFKTIEIAATEDEIFKKIKGYMSP